MLSRARSLGLERAWSADDIRKHLRPIIVALPAAGLIIGLLAQFFGRSGWAGPVWTTATIPVLIALVAEIIVSLRRGDIGLDIVAALFRCSRLSFLPNTSLLS